MSIRKMIQAGLFGLAILTFPVTITMADSVDEDDEEEEEAPPPQRRETPPPPPRRDPPPPPPRRDPPPPPRAMPAPDPTFEGFYLAPEIVYWQFRENDVTYASDSGGDFEVEPDYELGWRLGLGYVWDNQFDLIFRGTFVEAEESDGVSGAVSTNDGVFAGGAEGFVDVDYTTFDAEVGYTWGEIDGHRVRFFGGPRAVWIDQDVTVDSFPLGDGPPSASTFTGQEFEGIGLRLGAEAHLAFAEGWSLFINGAGSVVVGDFDQVIDTNNDGDLNDVGDFVDDFDRTVTALEAQAGFAWRHIFDDEWSFGLRFGYEFIEWADIGTVEDGFFDESEDFSADGAFLRFEWIF